MMLVEHRKRLKELKESENDRKKPILDDQEKEIINFKMQQALHNNLTVEIKYYEDKRFKKVVGKIDKVDTNQGYIFITNKKIPIKNLLELKLK
jgi:hypothetical protein